VSRQHPNPFDTPGLFERPALLLGAGLVLSAGAFAAAVIAQHVFGLMPCPWCILQRVIFLAIALVCVLGLLWRAAAGRVLAAVLTLLLGAGGVAAALWQHFVASHSNSCNLTLADKIVMSIKLDTTFPALFEPKASCADAAVSILGISMDIWSLMLHLVLMLGAIALLRAARQR
jgi:disulfide bond formation protein DsbB